MRPAAIFRLLQPVIRFLDKKMAALLHFLRIHYTPLAVIVLVVTGSAAIYALAYLTRYDSWNFRAWRQKAISKIVWYSGLLIASKIVLSGAF
mgnify:CR=1 FL=1